MKINIIYNEDCFETFKRIDDKSIDLVLTDPPYPDQHFEYGDCDISFLNQFSCRQLVFWSPKVEFPLDYTAIHIWDKVVGIGLGYERIFERNGHRHYRVYRAHPITCEYIAMRSRDVWTGHKSQKPIYLITKLIEQYSKEGDTIFDPFIGSGTTAIACLSTNRNYIGCEPDKGYYDIAIKRIERIIDK